MDPLKVVDQAAGKDMSWWFVAILVVLGMFAYAAFNHLIKRQERLEENHRQERKEASETIKDLAQGNRQLGTEVTAALQRSSDVIAENTAFFRSNGSNSYPPTRRT